MTAFSYHVTCAFQSESTLYSDLNIKKIFAQKRCNIWSLSDCNGTRTHKYLVRKWTLKHLVRLAKCVLICTVHLILSSYELSGCGFKSHCSHLNFRYRACFEQGVSWHSDQYRVWIHSETRTWHDKKIESNAVYRQVLTKQFNHVVSLAKSLSVCLRTEWLWVRVPLHSLMSNSYSNYSDRTVVFLTKYRQTCLQRIPAVPKKIVHYNQVFAK